MYVCAYSTKSGLKDVLVEPLFSQEGVRSRNYHLLSGDLRNMSNLGDKILSQGIDTRFVEGRKRGDMYV